MSYSIVRIVRCSLLITLSLVCAASLGFPNKAQAATAPLLMEIGDDLGGDIFAYTGNSLKNMTGYGYNSIPILSPDGKTVAYSSYAKTYVEEQFGGQGRSGPPAYNIWVMDVVTGNAKRIADQPADNRTQGDTRVRPFITRSDPRWSPDSSFLIWMEQSEGTKTREDDLNEHLMLYRLSNGTTKEIFSQSPGGIGSAPPVEWNAQGISVISTGSVENPTVLSILDSVGNLRSRTKLATDPFPLVQWLNGESAPTIITQDELVDIGNDTRTKLLPSLEIYNPSAPDGLRFSSDSGYFDANWTLIVPGAEPLAIGKISDYAIAPDGKMAAYVTDDSHALSVFDGKKVVKVALSTVKVRTVTELQVHGLVWSPLSVRIRTSP